MELTTAPEAGEGEAAWTVAAMGTAGGPSEALTEAALEATTAV